MASSIVSLSSSNPSFGHVLRHQSENNILKLKLKKPKSWNWELSTSKSSANIDFPRVLLYDNHDKLLADIEEANLIINRKENEPLPVQLPASERSRVKKSSSFCVSSSTVNSQKTPVIIIGSDDSNGRDKSLNIDETNSSERSRSLISYRSNSSQTKVDDLKLIESHDIPNEPLEENVQMPEAPIYIYSAKGLVKRDFNAKEFDAIRNRSNQQSNDKVETNLKTQIESKHRCVTSDVENDDVQCQTEHSSTRSPLMKCKSMAEILGNDLTRKKSKRKIRRTKSSASTKYPLRNSTQNLLSSSSDENVSTAKPIYRIQKSAAGAIIVPDAPVFSERVRRRRRSKSVDKTNRKNKLNPENDRTSKPNTFECKTMDKTSSIVLSDPMDTISINKTANEHTNEPNEIASFVAYATDKHYKNHNKHSISIKSENNRLNVENGVVSSASSNNDVNNSMDTKQKKTQLNRKVSFVQFNDEMTMNNATNDNIHNDFINVQQTREFNQNGKCISTRPNSRKKKTHPMHGIKIKKSASVASFCTNNYSMAATAVSASDTDDYDFYTKPPMRHKKRRVSRPKSNITSYHDDLTKAHLQKNSDNVISNSPEKENLVKFDENLTSFENQWAFDRYKQNCGTIIDDLYENGRRQKCYETGSCDISTTNSIITPTNDNDFDDNVIATPYTKKNNHLNYRYQKVYQDGTDKTGYYTNTFFVNNIKDNERNNTSNKLNKDFDNTADQPEFDCNMGSNVSRNSAKGLSGRRTQSSGDLTNTNENKPDETLNQIETEAHAIDPYPTINHNQNGTVRMPENSQLMTVKKSERNKIFGSLPNHLDSDETYRENLYNKNKAHTKHSHDRYGMANNVNYPSLTPYKGSCSNQSGYLREPLNTKLPHANGETAMHLKLTLNRSNMDVGCDQGYGSERSPEDELPPILSIPYQSMEAQPQYQHKSQYNRNAINDTDFSFITQDCCFSVQVIKNERGLGISVYGGIDANVPYRGLIRIKRLFPNQSAWSTGMLQPGDILLEANETPLTGLTNHEALEVLRTTPNCVNLKVCRPHDEQFRKLSPPAEPPKPPQRSQHTNVQHEPQSPMQKTFTGEFEIVMIKLQGSLGFTLRKEDESVLGHYVRALVRDPAVSDGRIRPGDKIVAVNDVPLSPMTHEEAVLFLRQAKDRVKLRLFRDISQTPIASVSPSSSEQFIPNAGKPKASLRPEAMNLLIDLAHKNRKQSCDSYSTGSSVQSSSASPRRLRRNKVNLNENNTNSYSEHSTSKSFNYQNQTYNVNTQSSVCSDSETSTISQGSFLGQTMKQPQQQCDNVPLDNTYTVDDHYKYQQKPSGDESEYYNDEELWRMMDVNESGSGASRSIHQRNRPSELDVYSGSSGYTPVVSRKPMFQFSAANGYELNNLDNEALDAPVYNSMLNNPNMNGQPYQDGLNGEFTSLPCEAFSIPSRMNSNSISNTDEFSHKNPMYQSAHVQVKSKPIIDDEETYHVDNSEEGSKNLLKWKGVQLFGIDEPDNTMSVINAQTPLSTETTLTTSSEPDSSCATMIEINQIATDNAKDTNLMHTIAMDDKNQQLQIITVELSRGWNSRLGFSLRSESNSKHTIVSAIYSESVAAKDGRLKVGDRIVMVNDESVEGMTTAEIIDLLRIIRGSIVLVVKRPRI